jgi:hypothetical protein
MMVTKRTAVDGEQRRSYLIACAERERGERIRLRAQVGGESGRAGRGAEKGARTCEGGRRSRSRGRVHDRGTWAGGWRRANRWGRRGREGSGHACERNGADKPGPLGSRRKRGIEGARGLAPTGGTRLSGTEGALTRARAQAGLNGPTWAELAFLFSKEFLIAFLFIFSRVFNSNSNQIKHVQQFKEYLELNMMQHFMTHMVWTK